LTLEDHVLSRCRKTKHRCLRCDRPALFSPKGGRMRADRDHDLCQACFRNELNRNRGRAS
jgi:hypothetical protein